MSEEEKKAIERMTEVRNKNIHTFVDELTIVLNLIEKQNKELEPIRELGIPVKTVVAELNRLEDLEDDRVQMQMIINELRKENKALKKLLRGSNE